MAKGQSVEDLYITLGLDVSELTSDFIEVDKTITENLGKLNREKNFIKLGAQLDIGNLDPVKDAQEILRVKTDALNAQIDMQRTRVQLLDAAYKELLRTHDDESAVVSRAAEAHLKEQLALQELEKELEQVKKSDGKQDEPNVDTSRVGKFAEAFKNAGGGLQGTISGIKSAMGDFNSATTSTEGAVSKFGAAISKLKHPAVIAGATLTALPIVAHTVSKELIDMARPAIEAGNAIYQLSRRMDESVGTAAQFSAVCKAMGTDADYLLEQIEDLSKDFLTNGSEKTKTLQAFGVNFVNDDGTLKTYHERMLELADGMDRAAASGQKLEYQQMLTEERLGDMITAIEEYGNASKLVDERLVKSDLANPQLAKELETELNIMDMQAAELHNAFSQALMPVAADLIPQVTETFGNLVKIIKENKEEIQYFGDIASTVLTSVGKLANIAAEALGVAAKGLKEVLQDKQSAEIDVVVKDDSIKTFEDFKKYQEKMGTDFFSLNPAATRTEAMEKTAEGFARAEWKKVLKARAEEEEAAKAAQKAAEDETTGKKPPVSLDTSKLKEYQAELESIKYKATHSDIENQIYDINKWAEAQKEAARSAEEKAKIVELAEAKIQEAIRKSTEESKQRTQDYLSEAQSISSERTMSAYEKEIAQIDKWKEKAMGKAETVQDLGQKAQEVAAIEANAAAKAADAYEKEVERIKNATKSFQDEIYEHTHSQYENDMKKLWEKYQKGLSEGVSKDTMDSWFRLKQAEVNEKARRDIKGEYTRGGQFQYIPNYDVPNYVEQARKAIGYSQSYQPQNMPSNIKNPNAVYDVENKLKAGWTQYSGSIDKVLNFTGEMANASEKLSGSSQVMQSVQNKLSNVNNQMAVYDIDGKLKAGWTQYSGSIGKILTFTGNLANTTEQLSGASQEMQMAQNAISRINNQKPVYDIDGNVANGWTEQTGDFGKILTFNEELSTASQLMQNAAETVGAMQQNLTHTIPSQEQKFGQPTNNNQISINVNIGNAVTPDSESMTWLADAVSEKIAPIVENAIGDSENSYY